MVMVIIGILLSVGLPVTKTLIVQKKYAEDRSLVSTATRALANYALIRGGLPVAGGGNLLPASELGLASVNPYGNTLTYEVNGNLTLSATSGNRDTLCSNLQSLIASGLGTALPMICNDIGNNGTSCSDSSSVAFVVTSRGSDRFFSDENSDADGIYENPSRTLDGDYDDIVSAFSLANLYAECY